ncbi:MAG: hypothetical protein JNJ94_06260 [Chlorobi bacterium]|nr:hypothetical protein [Chlorobiota bacterium]
MKFKPRENLSPRTKVPLAPRRILLGVGIMVGLMLGNIWLMMVLMASSSHITAIASIMAMVLSVPISLMLMERKEEQQQHRGLVAGSLIGLGILALIVGGYAVLCY